MLELDDIQGNILAGFNTDFQVIAGLCVKSGADPKQVSQWLAQRAPEITTVNEINVQRLRMKAISFKNSLSWLFLAVSERIMGSTQSDVIFADEAFRRGMVRRSGPVLGDNTSPNNWIIGGNHTSIDVLLIVASNMKNVAEERVTMLLENAKAYGFEQTYLESANKLNGIEHFGFRDGISQPTIVGIDPDGDMQAGHFVYGYPKTVGSPPVNVLVDARGVTKNGSLIVIRRLEQDVALFHDFCASAAKEISAQWPDITPEKLQALIVGRWPHGSLVSFNDLSDPGQQPNENAFDFSDDFEGKRCPFWCAHSKS